MIKKLCTCTTLWHIIKHPEFLQRNEVAVLYVSCFSRRSSLMESWNVGIMETGNPLGEDGAGSAGLSGFSWCSFNGGESEVPM